MENVRIDKIKEDYKVLTFLKVLGIIAIILIIILVVMYFLGKKLQKKQDASQEAMDAAAQQMTLYIIDMKLMKAMDANLPKMVTDQIPKYMRRAKLPIVKAKVGPKIISLICDAKVFETIAPKQEVKATVSGIYITAAKRIRGPIVETDPAKRKAAKKAAKKAEKEQKKAEKKKKSL
jgi:hypothetical protein